MEHCFLFNNIMIKNVTFPYKAALSEANVKTNTKGSKKWAYQKRT